MMADIEIAERHTLLIADAFPRWQERCLRGRGIEREERYDGREGRYRGAMSPRAIGDAL